MNFWIKLAAAVVAVWLVAAGVVLLARAQKATPEKVAAYFHEDMSGESSAERARHIARAASMLNELTFEERQQLRGDREQEKFFRQLTPDEQGKFLDATLPTGFRQMMENFNRMDPVKRKQFVDRALAQMKAHEGDAPPPRHLDDKNVQKIVSQGLHSFYNDSSADVKLDLAPLIEEMQKSNFGR